VCVCERERERERERRKERGGKREKERKRERGKREREKEREKGEIKRREERRRREKEEEEKRRREERREEKKRRQRSPFWQVFSAFKNHHLFFRHAPSATKPACSNWSTSMQTRSRFDFFFSSSSFPVKGNNMWLFVALLLGCNAQMPHVW